MSIPTNLHQDHKLIDTTSECSQTQRHAGSQMKVSLHTHVKDSITSVDSGLEASIHSQALSYTYPFLDTKSMSEDEVEILKGRLYNEFTHINRQYSTLKVGVIRSLNERGITPKQLSTVLMDLHVKGRTNCPPLQDQLDKIRREESIDDAFYTLRSYDSFFNYHIVKHIIDNLGNESDKAKLEQYERALDEYCQRNIYECPHFSTSDPNKRQLVLKVDEQAYQLFTLESLRAFRANLVQVLGLEEHTLLVYTVEKGCLKITFQIPHFVVDVILSLTAEQKVELRKLGVIQVISDKYTFDLNPQKPKVPVHVSIIL